MNRKPRILIIAGPHGAGKTTFAREFLPLDAACPRFINADLIAQGLSPFAPATAVLSAQTVMQQEFERLVAARESFAFETTLVERDYSASITAWQAAGYRVKLIFLQLDHADLAVARTARRALFDGGEIDENVIRREWAVGFENFETIYAPLVESWALYDNSGVQPMLLGWSAKSAKNSRETLRDRDLRFSFNALRRATKQIHDMAMLTGEPIIISRYGVIEYLNAGLDRAAVTIHEPRSDYEVG